jgi:hypothetical protein
VGVRIDPLTQDAGLSERLCGFRDVPLPGGAGPIRAASLLGQRCRPRRSSPSCVSRGRTPVGDISGSPGN